MTTLESIVAGKNVSKETALGISNALEIEPEELFDVIGTDKTLSPKTLLHYHRCLSAILSKAVKWGLLFSNPCERVDPPKLRRREAKCLNEEQTLKLIAALDEKGQYQYSVMVKLMIFSGARRAEICGLEWDDVDWDKSCIHICRNSLYLPNVGMYEDTTKTESSERYVKLPQSVMTILSEFRNYQNGIKKQMGEGWQESGEIPRTNLTYGEPVSGLAQSTWTRTGYHFVSWYLSDGTDTDKTAQVVDGKLLLGDKEFIPTEPGQVLTLSARWKVNTYRIAFDGVGSTDSLPTCNETFTFGTQSNYVMPQGITREGFNFMGWRVSESLVLQPGVPWPADFPAENGSTVTVWAEWEQIQQSDELQEDAPVLLPPSGGENSAPTPSEPLTTEPPEPPTEPRKEPQQEPPAEPNSSDGAEGEA